MIDTGDLRKGATMEFDGRLVKVDRVEALRDLAHHQVELRFAGEVPLAAFSALPGVSEGHRPEHFDVANAIGAAIASVSGEVDRIFPLGTAGGRQAAVDEATQDATDRAVAAGAAPEALEIIEIEEIPLSYLTDPAVRIRVKVAGPLRMT